LFKPGKMTRDFMEGKRVRYMPPFRFYIFVSFVFFLMLNFQTRKKILESGINVKADTTDVGDVNFQVVGFGEESDSGTVKLEELLEQIENPDTLSEASEIVEIIDSVTQEGQEEFSEALGDIISESMAFEDSIQNALKETGKKTNNTGKLDFKHIIEHPEIYVERFFKYASWSLFFLMPVFALLLLLFFRKTYKHYITHLIFAINQHAFLFVLLILMLAVKMIFPEKEINIENKLVLLSPIYLLVGARLLYKRNWIRTFFSLLVSVFLYVLIIAPVIVTILILSLTVL
jgi:hypothetical protein